MSGKNSKPAKTFRSGKISVSIWKDEVNKDGHTVVRHSIRLQKQFQNDNDDWIDTDYYFPDELPRVEALMRKAYEFLVIKEGSGK